jgi:putative oxidoreductase
MATVTTPASVSEARPNLVAYRADLGLLLIRGILGVVFAYHGAQKLFGWFGGYGIEGTAGFFAKIGVPLPTLSVILAGSAEFFGGLALILGVGVGLVSIPMVFTMVVAIATVHPTGFNAQTGGMEYPLTLALATAGLGLVGPGRLSAAGLRR